MKRILLSMAAVAALTSAAPAFAQSDTIREGIETLLGGGGAFRARIQRLDEKIERAFQQRQISGTEARRLNEELSNLRRLENEYRHNGINREERLELERRIDLLDRRISDAINRRDDRYDRDDDRYDRDDDRYDRDDDRYDRDDDRYGRDDDDQYRRGHDRRADGWCPPGLAKKNNGCLPPGQAKKSGDRYDGNFGPVPARYRDQFRDTASHFYRYDNGRIYQIGRRSGTIIRVIDVRR